MFPGLAFSLSQTENHVFSFIHQHRDFGCRHAMEDVKMFSFEISDDKNVIIIAVPVKTVYRHDFDF